LLQHKLLPELIDRRGKLGVRPIPIRIWSAACSTGQEVYTIGIVLKELLGSFSGYDIRILGTDISNRAIAVASHGYYSELEMGRGLPLTIAGKHFVAEAGRWKIQDEIRSLATFRKMNLLEPFSFPAPFDIILCRNVAIYFSEPDRARMFGNLSRCLARDGSLIIGSTESLTGLCPSLVPRRYLRAVYYELQS
jgi:chemotaxis protein methyltransferase CheR